jgi:hypothetical protein
MASVLLPLIVLLVSLHGSHWHAASDQAAELLRIDEVGGRHTSLVGVFSRFGWSHPGPLLFWLLAPFHWLFGNTGVLFGVGVLNGVAMAASLFVARRRGGVPMAIVTGIALLLLMRGLEPSLLVDPWNPWVAVLPALLFVLLAWSVADRDFATLPWLAVVGSFLVQTHVGYAPLVLGLTVAALVCSKWMQRGTPPAADAHGWFVVAAVVTVVLWIPPVLQQFTGDPGNLGEIVSYFRDVEEPVAGWRSAFGYLGTELGPPGAWIAGNETDGLNLVRTGSTLPALALLGAMAGFGALAWRRGATSATRFALLALLSVALGIVAGSRVTGFVAAYLVRWWWVIAATVWCALAWCAWSFVASTRGARVALGGAFTVVIVLSLTLLPDARAAQVPGADFAAALEELTPRTAEQLSRDDSYLLRAIDTRHLGAVGTGLFVALEQRGFDVRVERPYELAVGRHHTADPSGVDHLLLVVSSHDRDWNFTQPLGAIPVAEYDPLTEKQRARLVTLARSIYEDVDTQTREQQFPADTDLARASLTDHGAERDEVEEFYDLERTGVGYTVYLVPGA